MALVLLGCGCDCEAGVDPCNCSDGCTLLYRDQTGVATLCGFGEFIVSSPPRYFRKKQILGQLYLKLWTRSDCTGVSTDSKVTFAGSNQYDRSTCVETKGLTATGDLGSNIVEDISSSTLPSSGANCVNVQTNLTNATRRVAFDNGFGGFTCAFGFDPQPDAAVVTLSDEDTEEDAVARVPLAWGPWGRGTGCSVITPRSGASLTFTRSQVRITAKGTPGSTVYKNVTYLRQIYGVGDLMEYRTDTVSISIGSDGTGYIDQDVPLANGYRTCVGSCKSAPS